MTMRKTKHAVRIAVTALAAGAVLVAAVACGGASSSGAQPAVSATAGGTLTVAGELGATTLNPDTTNQADCYFEELAYEPLIVRLQNGGLAPGLATSWHYVGSGNTRFVLNLRSGVKFSDGTTLTAQDVVNDFDYLLKAGGQMVPEFAGDSFAVTGPMQVTITAAVPGMGAGRRESEHHQRRQSLGLRGGTRQRHGSLVHRHLRAAADRDRGPWVVLACRLVQSVSHRKRHAADPLRPGNPVVWGGADRTVTAGRELPRGQCLVCPGCRDRDCLLCHHEHHRHRGDARRPAG